MPEELKIAFDHFGNTSVTLDVLNGILLPKIQVNEVNLFWVLKPPSKVIELRECKYDEETY